MSTTLNDVLLFANQNPSSWLATSENNQPHVRGMLMWYADETGFYYHTSDAKRLYRHIMSNPKVEVAFIRNPNDPINFETLHVTGIAEEVNDKELEERLFRERPWLWDNIKSSGFKSNCVIFRITKGSAYIWNMSWNIKEAQIPRVQF